MKSKLQMFFCSVWFILLSIVSPICYGIIYMNITGHAKGYAYDLGPEKDISIMIGVVELIIYLLLLIPTLLYLCKKFYNIKKWMLLLPLIGYVVFFGVGIKIMGWSVFLYCFGR